MSLTPEERQKIYEEEKARLEARERVQAEADAQKKAEEERKKSEEAKAKKKERRQGCFTLIVIIAGVWWWISSHPSTPTSTPSAPTRELPKIGQERYLYKAPFAAVDQKSIDAFEDAYFKKDKYGQMELITSGRIFEVADFTKVLILDHNTANSRVRILEGPYRGRAVWVRNEWIK